MPTNKQLDFYKKAKKLNIPIIRDLSIKYIINLFKENNVKTVLEIGSAIGYSAFLFSLNNFSVISLEKDVALYNMALENKKEYNIKDVIFINADATTYKMDNKFDAIFIDAAKSKYLEFFKNFENNLNENGVIVCDNILFGLKDIDTFPKRLKPIAKKMHNFIEYVKTLDGYSMQILEMDDGLLLLKKVK